MPTGLSPKAGSAGATCSGHDQPVRLGGAPASADALFVAATAGSRAGPYRSAMTWAKTHSPGVGGGVRGRRTTETTPQPRLERRDDAAAARTST